MACRSAVRSIRRTVVTLPSGDVCSRSQRAAQRLSPLQRTPMSLPDMPVSANRCVSVCVCTIITAKNKNDNQKVIYIILASMFFRMVWCLLWSQRSCLTETTTCCAASTSQRRLVHDVWQSVKPPAVKHFLIRLYFEARGVIKMPLHDLGPGCCVQGSLRSPRVPGGHPAEAQHGHSWTLLH